MARFLRVKPIEWHGEIALRVEIYGCMRGEQFIITNHKNYKFLDCDWFKNFYFPRSISQSHSKLLLLKVNQSPSIYASFVSLLMEIFPFFHNLAMLLF